MMKLGRRNIRTYVQPYNGELRIHIRRFNGDRPTMKGVALLLDEWSALKTAITQLDHEITSQQIQVSGALTRTPYQRQNAIQANDPQFDLEAVISNMRQTNEPTMESTETIVDNDINGACGVSEPTQPDLLNQDLLTFQSIINIDENANFAWEFNEFLDNITSEKKE